jgi:hypothetical protein
MIDDLVLPRFDRSLLQGLEKVVPRAERDEWSRAWQAELWHVHHRRSDQRLRRVAATSDLAIGILRDALWLRTESWRRAFSGTAILCLASLLGMSLLSTLFALLLGGGWRQVGPYLAGDFVRTLGAAPFVIFVAFATASRRHMVPESSARVLYRCKRFVFFVVKVAQVLLLAFLLSADLCLPLHASMSSTAELLQLFMFVAFALLGLRWAFRDQEERCKQCLQSLTMPARVGRPSHNLLEWNGMEMSCKRGHGRLSVPEIETSWCQSSQWKTSAAWDRLTVR